MLAINHNLSALNVSNTLSGHYSRLQTSTQRLSSGLRINSAADDAAGLAIRELMRADIAALRQGIRNVNDGISMIQTMDGALGVIDEKLIRMKELAEQAATGTYNSDQRLMIDSEFQAMGEEINRIARATDFNGIKLLNGENVGGVAGIATHIEIVVGDKTYDVTGGAGTFVNGQINAEATQAGDWDLTGITDPSVLPEGTINISVTNNGAFKFGDNYLLVTPIGFPSVPAGTALTIEYDPTKYAASDGWNISVNGVGATIDFGTAKACQFTSAGQAYVLNVYDPDSKVLQPLAGATGPASWTAPPNDTTYTSSLGTATGTMTGTTLDMTIDLGNGNTISNSWTITNGSALAVSAVNLSFTVKDKTPKPVVPPGPTDPDDPLAPNYKIPDDVIRIHFGAGADKKEDFYDIHIHDATLKGLGLEDVNIQTQENAQNALVQVNDAIIQKDKIRAEYGAMQNRLENTMSNLSIQAENLQAAESRISDTEIAQEMMEFVRNQILTNSAVAMLAQANNLPQMVLTLIR